jgi:hypothetical protein
MPKDKKLYPKGYVTRVINSIPQSQRKTIRACVRTGCTIDYLITRFGLSEKKAHIVYLEFKQLDTSPLTVLGHKNEPYYEDEIVEIPKYDLESLSPSEKEIANKDTSTKLWIWEE